MIEELEVIDVAAEIEPFSGPAQAAVETHTEYVVARVVPRPRNFARFLSNTINEAKLAGAKAYYRWELKDKSGRKTTVQGASVGLAQIMARNYGNCAIDCRVEQQGDHDLFSAVFIDHETGCTTKRLYRQRRLTNVGRYDADRLADISFQVGQSKAIRNVILRSLPEWIADQAIEAAREAEVKSIKPENLALARAKVLDFFSRHGITAEQIARHCVRDSFDTLTVEDVADLRATATGIQEGRVTAAEVFASTQAVDGGALGERLGGSRLPDPKTDKAEPLAEARSRARKAQGEAQQSLTEGK